MSFLKFDLHTHTIYSGDSLIKPRELLKAALEKNLDGLAICDHGNLKAYRELKEKALDSNLILIPGMEIETNLGEILGLFLEDEPKFRNMTFFHVVSKIKESNGLVVIPHPFDILRRNRLRVDQIPSRILKSVIDGIEILNSRIILKSCVERAKKFNKTLDLFVTGGSDAHLKKEVGTGLTIIPGKDLSLKEIKNTLLSQKSFVYGKLSSPLVHVKTVINKFMKGLYF